LEELHDCSDDEAKEEDWAPAVAVVAAGKTGHPTFPWSSDSVRLIVSFSDEGPRCGNPIDDPGVDRNDLAEDLALFRVKPDGDCSTFATLKSTPVFPSGIIGRAASERRGEA
jgi:hypothetical protein